MVSVFGTASGRWSKDDFVVWGMDSDLVLCELFDAAPLMDEGKRTQARYVYVVPACQLVTDDVGQRCSKLFRCKIGHRRHRKIVGGGARAGLWGRRHRPCQTF